MGKILITALGVFLAGCSGTESRVASGKKLAAWYGCGSCHEIPGIPGATGKVAPPLTRVARRAYITGSVPNTPANMIRWIREPRMVDARTIMPDMNISEQDGGDIVAFLYTLD